MASVPFRDRPVLEHIVEQHAEEAAFLWTQRDAATEAPHYKRHHLARLDERVEAHVDGLRVSGEIGWRIALEQLERNCDKGELFAAGVLALELGTLDRLESLIAFTANAPAAHRGLVGAIAWCSPAVLAPFVKFWHRAPCGIKRRLVLCACSVHRADPGPEYDAWINDDDNILRARALRLAGELGMSKYLPSCLQQVSDSDVEVSFWAAWSAVLLGDRGSALHTLEKLALAQGPRSRMALEVAVRAMGVERGITWVRAISGDPRLRWATVLALGHLGLPTAVPWLIERLYEPDLARTAGEAFSTITGADLAYEDLERGSATDEPSIPNDSSMMDAALYAQDLPWPDPLRINVWWASRRNQFNSDQRYLCGEPIMPKGCATILAGGYQRQRRSAAYEAKLSSPTRGLPVWRGRSARQA